MATSINTVVISGRLTRNCEVSDYGKTSFSIAVDKRVKKGERWENVTNYFDVEAWKQPQFVNDALTKGRMVVISGSLDSFTYEKDGSKSKKVFVRAETIQLIHSGKTESKPKALPDDDFDPMWDREDDIP